MRWIVINDGSTTHMFSEKSVTITINKNSDGTKNYLFVIPQLKIMQSSSAPQIFNSFEEATAAVEKM